MTDEVENVEETQEAVTDEPGIEQAADELESATSESDSNSEADGDSAPAKPAKGVQKRINELVSQRESAEKTADSYRQQVESLTQLLQQQMTQKPTEEPEPAKPAVPPAPMAHNYDTDEAYQSALQEWGQSLAEAGRQAAMQEITQSSQQTERQTRVETFQKRVQDLSGKHPDAVAVVNNPAFPQSETVAEILLTSEKGAELAYHLGTNLHEAMRINGLPPVQAAIELGRIEATLQLPTPKTVTGAPEPTPSVSTGRADPAKNPYDLPMDKFGEWYIKNRANQVI